MLKKTITYTDFNGIERTEDFYFNMTKAELVDMQLTSSGGYADYLQAIVDAKDVPALVKVMKELVFKAYGKKSEDGRRFIKSEELSKEFAETEAYSDLYMELVSDDKKAADFINGIIPKIDTAAALPNA